MECKLPNFGFEFPENLTKTSNFEKFPRHRATKSTKNLFKQIEKGSHPFFRSRAFALFPVFDSFEKRSRLVGALACLGFAHAHILQHRHRHGCRMPECSSVGVQGVALYFLTRQMCIFSIGCGGMNFDVEASDEQIKRKRGRDAETILQADGISSFEARRINVSATLFIFYSTAHIWCRCSCYLDSSK